MIETNEQTFYLHTSQTSYIIHVNKQGHLEHLYYGPKIEQVKDIKDLRVAYDFEHGSATSYREDTRGVMLHQLPLEYSTYGKGDYREPSLHIELPNGSRTIDLTYKRHSIMKNLTFKDMPQADKEETLVITLEDAQNHIEVELFYTAIETDDAIIRNVRIYNRNEEDIVLDRALSMTLDMPNDHFILSKVDGAWIREAHVHDTELLYGNVRFDSKKGVSSSDHNPFFILKQPTTLSDYGLAYGFALIYSGNYEAMVEIQSHDMLRINLGINSFDFRYRVKSGASFITPEVVLTCTNKGLNTVTKQFHKIVNNHIVHKEFRHKERPIVINNWEATYFDFNEKKILAIAKKAKQLGIECFCLDDGWFGKRNDDTSSLGDWFYNPKKVKHGIKGLADRINTIGLDFGIWVEPEMVNIDSELYRAHPEWAISAPGMTPSIGRHQLMLDLSNPDVQDYLKTTLTTLLQSANIAYVKWDMNRNISDVYSHYLPQENQGNLHYDYIRGLYHVLEHLKQTFPHVLFEGCSSGGNRFDLGMLYYMPQTWTSDNTDPYERIQIQGGTSILYPLSSISNHVSSHRSHQTLRATPLESKFNVACFGVLGYELDVTKCTPFELNVIKDQITFYKEHRRLFQYGTLSKLDSLDDQHHVVWMVESEEEAMVLYFQDHFVPNNRIDAISIPNLPEGTYDITNRQQYVNIRLFGSLINRALPIRLTVNSWLHNFIANRYLFPMEKVHKVLTSSQLEHGKFILPHPFTGTDHGDNDMLLEDYGSRLYHIKLQQ